jgi:archaellum component FlaG (FlaF/FlaG flagellin family)
MKKRITGLFQKLWKEESGASHIVEIIVVIIVVIALAGVLLTRLQDMVNNAADKADEFIDSKANITVEVPYEA